MNFLRKTILTRNADRVAIMLALLVLLFEIYDISMTLCVLGDKIGEFLDTLPVVIIIFMALTTSCRILLAFGVLVLKGAMPKNKLGDVLTVILSVLVFISFFNAINSIFLISSFVALFDTLNLPGFSAVLYELLNPIIFCYLVLIIISARYCFLLHMRFVIDDENIFKN